MLNWFLLSWQNKKPTPPPKDPKPTNQAKTQNPAPPITNQTCYPADPQVVGAHSPSVQSQEEYARNAVFSTPIISPLPLPTIVYTALSLSVFSSSKASVLYFRGSGSIVFPNLPGEASRPICSPTQPFWKTQGKQIFPDQYLIVECHSGFLIQGHCLFTVTEWCGTLRKSQIILYGVMYMVHTVPLCLLGPPLVPALWLLWAVAIGTCIVFIVIHHSHPF